MDSQYDVSPVFRYVSVFVLLRDFVSFHRLVHNSVSQFARDSPSNDHM